MRAAVCRAFGQPLVIENLRLEGPGPGEVRVRLQACAICHSDIHFAEGAWGGVLPAVYGHEAAGVVEAIGPGVAGITPGDPVVVTLVRACGGCRHCGADVPTLCDAAWPVATPLQTIDGRPVHQGMATGAFAEEVVVHASQVVAVPAGVPPESAALLACGVVTGVGAVVNAGNLRPGMNVAVVGAGGVGLNSVQGAALGGANAVIAVDPTAPKREAARAFGATHAVDPVNEDAAGAVRAATGGRGADLVVVAVGAPAAIEAGLSLLARGGTMVVAGMTASGTKAAYDPLTLAFEGQRIVGCRMGSGHIGRDIPRLADLYLEGRLKLDELISGRYPLDRINEAVTAVVRGDALRNVIVF